LIVNVWQLAKNRNVSLKKVVTDSLPTVPVVLADVNQGNDIFGQSGVGLQAGEVFARKLGTACFAVSARRPGHGIVPIDGKSCGGSWLNLWCLGRAEMEQCGQMREAVIMMFRITVARDDIPKDLRFVEI